MKFVDSNKNQNLMSDLYCKQLRKSLFCCLSHLQYAAAKKIKSL